MNNWLNSIQNILLPPRCYLCEQPGDEGMDLCRACYDELPLNRHSCSLCAEPLVAAAPIGLCGRCIAQPPAFAICRAPFLYQHAMRYLISQLKYRRHPRSARLLAQLMLKQLTPLPTQPECLIPVPLYPARHLERGFNQALEISRHLSKSLSIPLDAQSCARIRDTGHQTQLNARQRRQNLRRAFMVAPEIAYRHVAIVDDVLTTGATASALSEALMQRGVETVEVWVCARA